MKKLFILILLITTVIGFAESANQHRDLIQVIESGDAVLTARGNGGCAGAAIEGSLTNRTAEAMLISMLISQREGFFLRNSQDGQNMIGIAIIPARYNPESASGYLKLSPKSKTDIIILALCADFHKRNPLEEDNFSHETMPDELKDITSRINQFFINNVVNSGDLMKSVKLSQIALWKFLGVSKLEMSTKFDFEEADWMAIEKVLK